MTTTDIVGSAVYIASLLLAGKPTATPSEIAIALKDPRVYPNLTALQMGTVLKNSQVFPNSTAPQITQALTDAGYAPADVQQSVQQLFPPVYQYRQLGPAGGQGVPFDDTAAAKSLAQPLTKVSVHYGNIIDGIATFYGSTQTAFSTHGGSGGSSSIDIQFDPGDTLVGVSGFSGAWFGGNYILQLTFHTAHGKTYGPYGDMQFASTHIPFNLAANQNEHAIAFLGSVTSGNNGQSQYLSSIGMTVRTG